VTSSTPTDSAGVLTVVTPSIATTRWEITREGDDHPPTGTSVHYHAGCAPFGATSIPDEIEREQARKQAGEAMRRDLAEGFDAE